MAYKQIRTVAFRFVPNQEPVIHQFYTLNFPERWKGILQALQKEGQNGAKKKFSSLPISTLNKSLRALIPDLISIASRADRQGERTWLYSSQPISSEKLHMIALAWVRHAFPKASEASCQRVMKDLQAHELQWQTKTLDLTRWTQEANGTARLPYESFTILPDFLAAHLNKHSLDFGPETLNFIRAPLAPGMSGAELISWPPLWIGQKTREAYSVVLTITVQTIPFQPFPVIHCDFSLRRWVSRPETTIPGGRETSVYLLTDVSWLTGLHSNSFQVAPVKWKKVNDSEEGDRLFNLTWGSNLAPILNDLQQPFKSFPTPEAMRQDPITALNIGSSPNAGIVFRDGMKLDHAVGKGLAPGDRRPLAEQLEQLFGQMLTFVDSSPRVNYTCARPTNPFFQRSDDDSSTAQEAVTCRNLIRQAVGDQLNIEILHQSSEVKDALIGAMEEILGAPTEEPNRHWHTPEIDANVQCNLLGRIGARLEVDTKTKDEKKRVHQAIGQRVDQIVSVFPKTPAKISATFIELEGKDNYSDDPETDPKHALRIGFAHTHRVTQFITPTDDSEDEEDNLPHRAYQSMLDMLRQLGVQIDIPTIPELPTPLNFVGLWLTKQYRKSSPTRTQEMLPVLVYINAETKQILATASGLDEWLSYPQALLAIAQGQATGFAQPRQAMPFIRETLEGEILPQGHTLLFCHAQNLRQAWPWLANTRLSQDSLSFGNERPMPISQWPGLRVVRIRSNQGHETPEWFAEHESYGDDIGFSKGLFQMRQRVFASTYNKPAQFKFSPSLSKVTQWKGPRMKNLANPSPRKYIWNPVLYELTVACLQPEDQEAWPWAAITHELRDVSLHYADATALPLPLHLARGMEEYVLRLSG